MGAVSDIYNQWAYIWYTLRSPKGRTPFNSGRSLPGTPVRERFTPTDMTNVNSMLSHMRVRHREIYEGMEEMMREEYGT